MSRISTDAMAKALIAAQAMDLQQKEHLADEVFRAQPNLLGPVVVLPQLGIALSKVDFTVGILFVSFLAMKASGLTWPVITEDDQDRQLQRFVAMTRFGDDLNNRLRQRAMQQYIADHPEMELLAYVTTAPEIPSFGDIHLGASKQPGTRYAVRLQQLV